MATIKDLKRMCKETKCKDCPFSNGKGDNCLVYTTSDDFSGSILVYLTPDCFPDNADEIVDKWVKEHPIKTYLQDFFEKYPKAPKEEDGIPITRGTIICRKELYSDELPCIWSCSGCTKCWNQEIKEDE